MFEEGYDNNGFLIEEKKPSNTKGKASKVKVVKSKLKFTSMQHDKKQSQKKWRKQAQRGKTLAKKSKDAFIARFYDDSSYTGKFLYSPLQTLFTLSLSLDSVFSSLISIIQWYISFI